MKYRVVKSKVDESFDVVTEDGGVSYHYHSGANWVSNYYSGRLTSMTRGDEEWWIEIQDWGIYIHDWEEGMDDIKAIINAALDWLVFPAPAEGWEQDDSIWSQLLDGDE